MSTTTKKRPLEFLREARIAAGYVSRGTASTAVPFSPETIGRHERGDIEMEPEDAVTYAESYKRPHVLFLKRVEAFLELMPELVHCKDCKYYLPEKIGLETAGNCMHEDGLCGIDCQRPDDFCSMGRRAKEDDKSFCAWCVFWATNARRW